MCHDNSLLWKYRIQVLKTRTVDELLHTKIDNGVIDCNTNGEIISTLAVGPQKPTQHSFIIITNCSNKANRRTYIKETSSEITI
ncbi:hypothetical protein Q1695_000930 [Nippostrongylus brasiliensis]|nr:hypothetical protein Q1695_000930 [Nippostrongylus brasiliensis]